MDRLTINIVQFSICISVLLLLLISIHLLLCIIFIARILNKLMGLELCVHAVYKRLPEPNYCK